MALFKSLYAIVLTELHVLLKDVWAGIGYETINLKLATAMAWVSGEGIPCFCSEFLLHSCKTSWTSQHSAGVVMMSPLLSLLRDLWP